MGNPPAPMSYHMIFRRAYSLTHSNPDAAVDQMTEAARLAREAGDAKSALYFEHWILQTLLYRLEDHERAYDLAVSAVVESRKPVHHDQMERICVHEDLISTYLGIDPIGYTELIERAVEYMTREIDPTLECRFCLLGLRIDYELAQGRLEQAEVIAQRYLGETADSTHHHGLACGELCRICHERRDWGRLLEYADLGLPLLASTRANARYEAAVLAARALALRKLGRDVEAAAAYRVATAKASTLSGTMARPYYDFLSDFLLTEGNLEAALSLRERQLGELVGKGQPYWEAVCRLQLADLLKRLHRPFDSQGEPIHTLAARLRRPEPILQQWAALLI